MPGSLLVHFAHSSDLLEHSIPPPRTPAPPPPTPNTQGVTTESWGCLTPAKPKRLLIIQPCNVLHTYVMSCVIAAGPAPPEPALALPHTAGNSVILRAQTRLEDVVHGVKIVRSYILVQASLNQCSPILERASNQMRNCGLHWHRAGCTDESVPNVYSSGSSTTWVHTRPARTARLRAFCLAAMDMLEGNYPRVLVKGVQWKPHLGAHVRKDLRFSLHNLYSLFWRVSGRRCKDLNS